MEIYKTKILNKNLARYYLKMSYWGKSNEFKNDELGVLKFWFVVNGWLTFLDNKRFIIEELSDELHFSSQEYLTFVD